MRKQTKKSIFSYGGGGRTEWLALTGLGEGLEPRPIKIWQRFFPRIAEALPACLR